MAERYDLVVRGGEVVNHAGRGLADVAIRDGKVAAIGDVAAGSGAQEIDASGLHVLPGVIDTQVHFREPGLEHKEDLATGAASAALGGVVAVFEMPNTNPATVTPELLEDKFQRAAGRMWVDHAFFIGGTGTNAAEIAAAEATPGCPGVKVFMGSSTGSLLVEDDDGVRNTLLACRRRATFHSEDEFVLRANADKARPGDWTSHPDARPVEAAVSSTKRLIKLARETGRRIHVLHISTAEEVPLLAEAKDIATMEATPQHLTLAAPEAYERWQGYAQMNPPVREARHREALWKAVADGIVDVVGSDHAPHTSEEKAKPYPASPSGMPGVQTLVPLMLDHVNAGRLSLERFVDLTSTGAQRVFGTAGKGRLAVGYDGDLTLVDLKAQREIKASDQASRCGWTPFDGMMVTGWPVMTIVRGRVVMRDGALQGDPVGERVRFMEGLRARAADEAAA